MVQSTAANAVSAWTALPVPLTTAVMLLMPMPVIMPVLMVTVTPVVAVMLLLSTKNSNSRASKPMSMLTAMLLSM